MTTSWIEVEADISEIESSESWYLQTSPIVTQKKHQKFPIGLNLTHEMSSVSLHPVRSPPVAGPTV